MGGIGQIGFLNNSFGICIEISKHENRCWDLPIFLHRHLLEHDWYGVIPIIYLIFFWAVT